MVRSSVLISDSVWMNYGKPIILADCDVSTLPGLSKYTGYLDQSPCGSDSPEYEIDHVSPVRSDYSSPLYYDAHSERGGSFM